MRAAVSLHRSILLLALAGTACSTPNATDGGTTDGGDAGVVAGCNPTVTPDICQTGGEACTPDYEGNSETGYTCQAPGPFFGCIPEVGCATPNLQCIGADAGVGGLCLQTCASTADCGDPFTVCLPLADGGPTYCAPDYCFDFWQPCAAESEDGGDGTCVFVGVDPMAGPFGVCLQAGPVPLNGACSYYRDAGGQLCTNGTLCMVSDGEAPTGFCMAACDSVADGGPGCAGGCVYFLPPAPPPAVSALDFGTQGGGCASVCETTGACPAPYGCVALSTTGEAVCLP